jgi:hypothetical protein
VIRYLGIPEGLRIKAWQPRLNRHGVPLATPIYVGSGECPKQGCNRTAKVSVYVDPCPEWPGGHYLAALRYCSCYVLTIQYFYLGPDGVLVEDHSHQYEETGDGNPLSNALWVLQETLDD